MIAIGNINASKVYLGGTEVGKIYLGSTQVWGGSSPTPPTPVLPYDAEIEYLERDSAAYIDTGIEVKGTLQFEAKMKTVVGSYGYFGGYLPNQSSSANRYYLLKNAATGKEDFGYGAAGVGSFTAVTAIRTMSYKGTTFMIDSSSYTVARKTFSFNKNFRIFTVQDYGSAAAGTRVYYFKIWDGDTLVRDYIPVRVGQVGYLYDKVGGRLYGNANSTGAFILGNDVTN